MFVKSRTATFIDNVILEVQEAISEPIKVALRNEDGKICCKTEKKVSAANTHIHWEGLNDLPYGVYTLECSQGEEVIQVRMIKRI